MRMPDARRLTLKRSSPRTSLRAYSEARQRQQDAHNTETFAHSGVSLWLWRARPESASASIRRLGWRGTRSSRAVARQTVSGVSDDPPKVDPIAELRRSVRRGDVGRAASLLSSPKNISIADAETIIEIMRRKAVDLNRTFGANKWMPRLVDRVLLGRGPVETSQ